MSCLEGIHEAALPFLTLTEVLAMRFMEVIDPVELLFMIDLLFLYVIHPALHDLNRLWNV